MIKQLRAPCCDKGNVKRGPWSPEEDLTLKNFINKHGSGGNWISLPHKAGLKRCGKSCRLRWLNYLRPDIKHGAFSEEEDIILCNFYRTIGSRWSVMASKLPGRTDNDIKNYWNTKLKKKFLSTERNSHFNNQITNLDTGKAGNISISSTSYIPFSYPMDLNYQKHHFPMFKDVPCFANSIASSSEDFSTDFSNNSSSFENMEYKNGGYNGNELNNVEDELVMDMGFESWFSVDKI